MSAVWLLGMFVGMHGWFGWCRIYYCWLLEGGGWIALRLTVGLSRQLDMHLEGQVFVDGMGTLV